VIEQSGHEVETGTQTNGGDGPSFTRLERWAIALRVVAVMWWIGGLIFVIFDGVAYGNVWGMPGTLIARQIMSDLFFPALGGIVLFSFSYVLIGIDCLVENSAITAEAMLSARDSEHDEQRDTSGS
jgi:hypothetical protein